MGWATLSADNRDLDWGTWGRRNHGMKSGNQDMSHHAFPTPMASWLNRVWVSHLTSLRNGLAWQRALGSERGKCSAEVGWPGCWQPGAQ